MKHLADIFALQVNDLYTAEQRLLASLPLLLATAHHKSVKKAFTSFLKEARRHKKALRALGKTLGRPMKKVPVVQDHSTLLVPHCFSSGGISPEVWDAGLIAAVQRLQHYGITGYETAVYYAWQLELEAPARSLQDCLQDCYEAHYKLGQMAERGFYAEVLF